MYYTGQIREVSLLIFFVFPGAETGQVRAKDSVVANLDSMELEREKVITIQSAATFCNWNGKSPSMGDMEKFALNNHRYAWYPCHSFLFFVPTNGPLAMSRSR